MTHLRCGSSDSSCREASDRIESRQELSSHKCTNRKCMECDSTDIASGGSLEGRAGRDLCDERPHFFLNGTVQRPRFLYEIDLHGHRCDAEQLFFDGVVAAIP